MAVNYCCKAVHLNGCGDSGYPSDLNTFSTIVLIKDKSGSSFLLAKCSKNTSGRVTFQVKMQVIDQHLYLKYHSSPGVFQVFLVQTNYLVSI